MADDAVWSELVSAVISLLNREITGNLADFGLRKTHRMQKKPQLSEVFWTSSLLNRTGNFETRTGNYPARTGN